MGKSLTAEKFFGFAIRIVRLYKILYERKEFVLSKRMLRSGTAIGALLKEAEHAQSKADFISKVNIALMEAIRNGILDYVIDRYRFFNCKRIRIDYRRLP